MTQTSQAPEVRDSLAIELVGLPLSSPVMNASGTWDTVSQQVLEDSAPYPPVGVLVTKGLTLEPRPGNPVPRIAETRSGILNSIGLENPGLTEFLAEELPVWLSFGKPVIVNISGANVEEYVRLAQALDQTDIAAIEVNVSCPNRDGIVFGTSAELTDGVVSKIRSVTTKPVIVKLTPNVTDIAEIAQTAEEAGANAISAINTVLGMDVDINTAQASLGRVFGGLSGPAVLPIALKKVYDVAQAVKIPVIGMGGISSAEDAIKFFMVGAKAVAVGTANFGNPLVMTEIIAGIMKYLQDNGLSHIDQIPQISPAE